MPRQRNYHLSDEELKQVEAVFDENRDARMVKRALALRMLHYGSTPAKVAQQLRVTTTTVYNWCERFRSEQVKGLAQKAKSGRPRKATTEYQSALAQAIETDPTTLGYPFTVWTLERLRDHLEQTSGIRLSIGRFAALLEEMDYVYRRPKPVLKAKQNVDAKAQAEALLKELKKEQHKTIASSSLWMKRR